MELAEATISNAIKWSIQKRDYANIILAGPICSGKTTLSTGIKQWYETLGYGKVNVFDENDYYKDRINLPKNDFGLDIDTIDAFDTEKFVKSVKRMYEDGFSYSPYYSKRSWSKKLPTFPNEDKDELLLASEKYKLQTNERINIFTGLHTIELLSDIVPDAITIYLHTDFEVCMSRRFKIYRYNSEVFEKGFCENYDDYYGFIKEEVQSTIFHQFHKAQICLKA